MTGDRRRDLAGLLLLQLPLAVALVALWALLWGSVSWLTIATGILVALVVTRVFYLPPVALSGRFNVVWFLAFIGAFTADLFTASFQVALQAINPRWHPRPSILAVQLRTQSDLVLSLTAIATSLVPGTLVVEVDRARSVLYLHALNTRTADDVEKLRHHTLSYERRIVLAMGTHEDAQRVRP